MDHMGCIRNSKGSRGFTKANTGRGAGKKKTSANRSVYRQEEMVGEQIPVEKGCKKCK